LSRTAKGRKYLLLVDPLDGSSNIDINGTVGTIFSITRRSDETLEETPAKDFLQKGTRQVAAGYIMYGPSTILVFTNGDGVHGFTLDPGIGEFVLSHPNIQMPKRGKAYSINVGNCSNWEPSMRQYIDHLNDVDAASGRPYSLRYVGSLVADFHRVLLEGGVYLYPGDKKKPNGKLRLLYECFPLAFIAEQAGGSASNGKQRILDLEPSTLHQRCPLIIGSTEDVAMADKFAQADSV